MSISSIISNSLTGLFTNQAALRTISNNVANINTPGYARQIVRQEAIVNGTNSGGVRISGIQRIVDKFLVKAVYDANANTGRYKVENNFQGRIQAVLGRPDQNSSLSGRIGKVFTAMSGLALNPQSTIQKESSLTAINQFGKVVGSLAQQIQNMRLDASNQISQKVNRINILTQEIESINPMISRATLTGGQPGSLLEKRAQTLTELSKIIDLNIVDTGNNGIQVTTSSGILLVGASRNILQYSPPGAVTSSTPFPQITVHSVDSVTGVIRPSNTHLDGQLASGELKGLLTLRDKDLPEIALQLGSLAAGFTDELNRVHNQNVAVPAPNSLTGINKGLLATDNHNFTGKAVFAITDASGNLVKKVTIDFGTIGATIGNAITAVNTGLAGAGTLALNNGVMSLTATAATDGVSISQVAGSESDRAGRGFSQFFGMNNLVEANVASNFDTGIVGTDAHGFTAGGVAQLELNDKNGVKLSDYKLTISGTTFNDILTSLNSSSLSTFATFSYSSAGQLIATPKTGVGDITLHVKTDTTSRAATKMPISAFFGIGNSFRMDAAVGLKVSSVIDQNPARMALARFDQTAAVGGNALSVGDQSGAMALRDVETVVHNFAKAGGLNAASATLAQYSANLLANLGSRASLTDGKMQDSKTLSDELQRKSSDVSGVNLDEELANMVIFQNAYSASAKMLNTAKQMFDSILQIV
ncbi:MAG: flagellar hook-associated protein FlgK [Alphaproteobacteria bacterium]|nr:flagellar hook-associated protein FlgK [Alphaproteobacteria bacterium]